MKYVIYDVESTGLTRNDEVIEFGCFVANNEFIPVDAHKFFCYTQVPISEGAKKVNGLSAARVHALSGGKTFEDNFLALPFINDKDLVWVSYSNGGFDERLVNQTLKNNGLDKYPFGKRECYFKQQPGYVFDAYNALVSRVFNGRAMKLGQTMVTTGLTEEKMDLLFEKVVAQPVGFHDALYDAFVLWYVVNHYKERLSFAIC